MTFSPWILLKCVLALTSLTAAIGGPPACKYETIDDVNKNNQTGSILDITHQYRPELPSYGSTSGLGLFLRMITIMRNGSKTNTSEMKIVVHTGTHIDAPSHMYEEYFDACYDVDTLDLEVLNGPAMVVDVPRNSNITGDVMKSLNIPRGVKRVLFRTLNTDRQLMWKKEFDTSYVGFVEDGAKWLVENTDIKLVGTDYISIAAYSNIIPAHRVFLKNRDIILVEGLKLDNVPVQENYNLHCLPLRLRGADGSPTRCILMKI